MVRVEPEERAREQEAAHLVAAVVEDEAVPVGVEALPRVAVLVEVRAVEVAEPVLVGREVRRHPVEDDADAALVQAVDQVHQVLRRAVAAGRREVAGRLVAPRAVERVLHHRQELDVREAELGDVVGQRLGQLAVGERAVRRPPARGATSRGAPRRSPSARRAPGARRAAPSSPRRPRRSRASRRPTPSRGGVSAWNAKRVGLVDAVAVVARRDVVLVARAAPTPGTKPSQIPESPRAGERRDVAAPAVPVADHADPLGRRRPDREVRAGCGRPTCPGARRASPTGGGGCPR